MEVGFQVQIHYQYSNNVANTCPKALELNIFLYYHPPYEFLANIKLKNVYAKRQ